eukprot:TRINITY_DN63665_c0_g1_i1.p1 TRINITY_DN63665_c0_g1~~TRINITY_DN63665_c0_g1_i1.p1  ORF type:complete len:568 (-),score=76.90 TRINITY_DN63665_c0_g1_i1:79-1782(-)
MPFHLDNLLAYTTPKLVKIRDGRLGLLRILGVLGILAYFIYFPIYLDKAYLSLSSVVGTIDTMFFAPSEFKESEDMDYQHWKLPYCREFNGSQSLKAPKQERCLNLPTWDLIRGSTNEMTFISTRIKPKEWDVECMSDAVRAKDMDDCEKDRKHYHTFFVAFIENHTIGIKHAVLQGQAKKQLVRNQDIPGYVLRADGTTESVETFKGQGERDVFTVGQMMSYAGLGFEDLDAEEKTLRYNGATIILAIHYDHDFFGKLSQYTYSFSAIPLEGGFEPPYNHVDDHGAITRSRSFRRHGLKLIMKQTGESGEPSFLEFMTAWVSIISLLGGVDLCLRLLLKVLPLRKLYSAYTTEESVDFSEFQKGREPVVAAANHVQMQQAILKGADTFPKYCHSAGHDPKRGWRTEMKPANVQFVWDNSDEGDSEKNALREELRRVRLEVEQLRESMSELRGSQPRHVGSELSPLDAAGDARLLQQEPKTSFDLAMSLCKRLDGLEAHQTAQQLSLQSLDARQAAMSHALMQTTVVTTDLAQKAMGIDLQTLALSASAASYLPDLHGDGSIRGVHL